MGSTAKSDACAVCGAPVAPLAENPTFPFCSGRCRTIDLGRWLDERYRIPTAEPPADDGDDAD
jgi:endogenous inhibitor of DNA gyrase (YacG/DUF329 family)